MSGRRSPSTRRVLARAARALLALAVAFLVLTLAAVLPWRWLDPPVTAFMLWDRAASRRAAEPYPLRHRWVAWEAIAAGAKLAVVAAEDQAFADHRGFDVAQIRDAVAAARAGRRLRGASTITQQVAKNLFLWPGRDWLRKGLEAYFAVLLEALWPKRRILEVYLNVAEFGPGVYGVGAASALYFGTPAARLSDSEGALLAAVLPSPKRLHAAAPSAYVRERQRWIREQMRALGGSGYLKRIEPQRERAKKRK